MTRENFDPVGRERYAAKMNQVGYMEFRVFAGRESKLNFCCYACPYMRFDPNSPTDWWCAEVGFPDRPHGCCDKFEPFPEVRKIQVQPS